METKLGLVYATEAFTISAHRDAFGYWIVTIAHRTSAGPEWTRANYSGLTTNELVDVLDQYPMI